MFLLLIGLRTTRVFDGYKSAWIHILCLRLNVWMGSRL